MTTSLTHDWIARWDAQQEGYVADREERFRVVADVVTWATQGQDAPARVVDVGCGPGSLTTRLAAAVPGAQVVGVDADPVLLELARRSGAPAVRADLADPRWPDAVPLDGPWDAVVSSTALHWLEIDDLAALYRTVAQQLRPGGVFVDADHRLIDGDVDAGSAGKPNGGPTGGLGRFVRTARAERAGVVGREDWRAWWDAVLADPTLAEFVDARSEVAICHDGNTGLTAGQQQAMLREAGFSSVCTVWQSGDDMVVVAVR